MNKNYIEIKKVSKIYKNKFAALKNIDLNIQEEKFLHYWVQMEQENQL